MFVSKHIRKQFKSSPTGETYKINYGTVACSMKYQAALKERSSLYTDMKRSTRLIKSKVQGSLYGIYFCSRKRSK